LCWRNGKHLHRNSTNFAHIFLTDKVLLHEYLLQGVQHIREAEVGMYGEQEFDSFEIEADAVLVAKGQNYHQRISLWDLLRLVYSRTTDNV
jgi:hypothetical protein